MSAATIAWITIPFLVGFGIYLLPRLARTLSCGVALLSMAYGFWCLFVSESQTLELRTRTPQLHTRNGRPVCILDESQVSAFRDFRGSTKADESGSGLRVVVLAVFLAISPACVVTIPCIFVLIVHVACLSLLPLLLSGSLFIVAAIMYASKIMSLSKREVR